MELAAVEYDGSGSCGAARATDIFKANLAGLPESKHPVEDVLGEAGDALDGILQTLMIARF